MNEVVERIERIMLKKYNEWSSWSSTINLVDEEIQATLDVSPAFGLIILDF